MHGAKVVPDDADAGQIDRRPARHDVEAAPKPVHLGRHALAIRGRAARTPCHGNVSWGRMAAALWRRAQSTASSTNWVPIAVRCLGIEPVGEEQGRPRDSGIHDGRFDEVRLNRLTRATKRHPDVPNQNAVAIFAADNLEHGRYGTGAPPLGVRSLTGGV